MNYYEVVLYNVPVDLVNIEQLLKCTYNEVDSAKRILKYPNFAPTTLVRVRLSNCVCRRDFLVKGCIVGDLWFRAQLPRRRRNPRRCYNCQAITTDHIARNCPNLQRCRRCGECHDSDLCHSLTESCVNCGESHSANSKLCRHWANQNQHRGRGAEWMNRDNFYTEWKAENEKICDELCDMRQTIHTLREDVVAELKLIASVLPSMLKKSEDGSDSPLTWDDYDTKHNHDADLISADDPDANPDGDKASILTPSDSAGSAILEPDICRDSVLDQPYHVIQPDPSLSGSCSDDSVSSPLRPDVVNSGKLNPVDVNSEAVQNKSETNEMFLNANESVDISYEEITEKYTASECETVDAKSNPCSVIPETDPVYREYFERVVNEEYDHMDVDGAFGDKVLFRYPEGKIRPVMSVVTRDGADNLVTSCNIRSVDIRTLTAEQIFCCPFHVLAAEIRDDIDRGNMIASLRKWRTKDLSPWRGKWERF